MQSGQLDGNAGAVIDAATGGSATNGMNGGFVILVVTLGVGSGGRGLTQHIVGIAEAAFFQRLGALQSFINGFAGDKLFAHHPHGHVYTATNDRLAATSDQTCQGS